MEELNFQIAVVGGGIGGICSAIAAARNGAKTVLIQDRPVLGGNASSEIRMHICGASCHGKFPNRRETGILEEILLENKFRNPDHSYAIFDSILWEKARYQENLTLFLNTYMTGSTVKDGRITSIDAVQLTSERKLHITAEIYVDATGDGTLATYAGATTFMGRENRDTYGEENAVSSADSVTMGNSLMFHATDMGHPVPFVRPEWAYDFKDSEWAKHQTWTEITSGYWWLEIGGKYWNVIKQSEDTRDELLRIVYGIWDYIKTCLPERSRNLMLDWVGMIPAKRESRRIEGDYILTENDLAENRFFDDAVAYGGWHVDAHGAERFLNRTVGMMQEAEDITRWLDDTYQIPYRCLYSKQICNLMMAGRNISVSHRAFASTRVMGTCAVCGQAVGTAAALGIRHGVTPREVGQSYIRQLQLMLMRDDCYIPGLAHIDPQDLAQQAQIRCSEALPEAPCCKLVNGLNRNTEDAVHYWAAPFDSTKAPWVEMQWPSHVKVCKMQLVFDSNLSIEIMQSLSQWCIDKQSRQVPDTIISDYRIDFYVGDAIVESCSFSGNHQRLCEHNFSGVTCDRVRIHVLATNGSKEARIFAVRIYGNT